MTVFFAQSLEKVFLEVGRSGDAGQGVFRRDAADGIIENVSKLDRPNGPLPPISLVVTPATLFLSHL